MLESKRYEEFARLLRLHTSQILAYVRVLTLNWNDAEDIFQETCLVLWQKFDEFQPGSSFLAWALRIAKNKTLDFQKKNARRIAFQAKLRDMLAEETAEEKMEMPIGDFSMLSGCLARLAEGDRAIVKACYGDGQSVRNIAESLGRSPESVHRSLRRIRQWLLDCIERQTKQAEQPSLAPDDLTPAPDDLPEDRRP